MRSFTPEQLEIINKNNQEIETLSEQCAVFREIARSIGHESEEFIIEKLKKLNDVTYYRLHLENNDSSSDNSGNFLHVAASRNLFKVVKYLIEERDVCPVEESSKGKIPSELTKNPQIQAYLHQRELAYWTKEQQANPVLMQYNSVPTQGQSKLDKDDKPSQRSSICALM